MEQIAWAFDPLQTGNAHFNLSRLGARAHSYIENMYGTRTDALNAGVPTDRLIVLWSTTEEPRPHPAIDPVELVLAVAASSRRRGGPMGRSI